MIIEDTESADPSTSLARARVVHRDAMLVWIRSLVSPRKVHVELNSSRGVWFAWVGAATWERATLRGEWVSEAGALRRLLHCVRSSRAGLVTATVVREGREARTAHVDKDQMAALLARSERM